MELATKVPWEMPKIKGRILLVNVVHYMYQLSTKVQGQDQEPWEMPKIKCTINTFSQRISLQVPDTYQGPINQKVSKIHV